MDWQEALRSPAVARTGHVARFGWLCSDDNPDPKSRESHRGLVARLAAGPGSTALPAGPSPLPGPAEVLALTRAVKACPHRSTEGCGCGGAARCALKGGAKVFLTTDCFDCLRAHGGRPPTAPPAGPG